MGRTWGMEKDVKRREMERQKKIKTEGLRRATANIASMMAFNESTVEVTIALVLSS